MMTTQLKTEEFCALQTLNAAEPLYGTAAAEKSIWFLLEYNDPWAHSAQDQNNLPAEVQQWFKDQLSQTPQSEWLFIRQEKRPTYATIRFFIAISRESDQRLYAFEFETAAQVMELDVAAAVAGDDAYDQYLSEQTLFLVCTNGKRDQCCAKFGRPIYRAMYDASTDTAENPVWQTTHIGGHRYAPTLAVLPQGVFYGQVTTDTAAKLMTLSHNHEIYLDHYRGRTCYMEVQQAADYYLRQRTGRLELDAFQVQSTTQEGDGWRIVFEEPDQNKTYTLTVRMTFSEPVLASCTNMKSKPRPLYQLLSYDAT
ncbi:MAG: hypothetical protein KDE51_16005 [Anaerolineales bacterium]|nr:hypothetical protein [Anaerolineales bacterium]